MGHENWAGDTDYIVVASLGSVTKNLDKWLEKLDKRINISLFKKLR